MEYKIYCTVEVVIFVTEYTASCLRTRTSRCFIGKIRDRNGRHIESGELSVGVRAERPGYVTDDLPIASVIRDVLITLLLIVDCFNGIRRFIFVFVGIKWLYYYC